MRAPSSFRNGAGILTACALFFPMLAAIGAYELLGPFWRPVPHPHERLICAMWSAAEMLCLGLGYLALATVSKTNRGMLMCVGAIVGIHLSFVFAVIGI